ncbi:ABC transporter substrate-binding protein [Aureimonas sp. SK2]|uniref:ABC transporter substrate-binding protein n=1 Tax=Aureimonas sp. SK2 TaxID=3015992 RepID=UPI002443B3F0|nr:ABC transporter substrate-binding protein [Aureimonas sp. SK2]
MKRRDFLMAGGSLAALAALSARLPAFAQDTGAAIEKPSLTLGVGGKPLLYYLPLTIAERQGFFEEEGLTVAINDFGGGAKSLQALVGGSVDVVTGAYEHTLRMQHRGQDIRAVADLGRFPGITIAVRSALKDEIKTIADLKGRTMGVTAPGSSTALMLQYALVKAGLKPDDVSLVGIGGGTSAVAAVKRGEIAGLSHLDPVTSRLEVDGDIVPLIDTRTEEGTRELFGGTNPAATVYLRHDFVEANPVTTQRIVNAFLKSLAWLQTATPDQVADSVPEDYLFGDREFYKTAFEKARPMYSPDGVITEDGFQSMLSMLKTLEPDEFGSADLTFAQTFDPRFVTAAKG